MSASYTNLKGVNSLSKFSYEEILEHNIINFFDWGFINKDGFYNVRIPSSGSYGGEFSRLRSVNDRRYTNGQVWESARLNWVWESGLDAAQTPISISGVFVNNTFHPASGNSYYVDYPNGRIIFNNPISQSSTVRVEHSYKWINVISSQKVPWLRKVQQNSFRVDNPNFLTGSGEYIAYGQTRLQLPFVAVEVADGYYKGYELGGSQLCYKTLKFYVVGEDSVVNRIADVISQQNEKTIYLYDTNEVIENNNMPLTWKGSIAPGALTYPDMIDSYTYTNGVLHGKVSLLNAKPQAVQQLTDNIIQKVVTITAESVLTRI
jgi:hypothetical protein